MVMGAGTRIAERRQELGLSQQELAGRVNRLGGKISQTGIDKLEKRDAVRPRHLKEIARALDVSEDWLISGRLPKTRQEQSEIDAVISEIGQLSQAEQQIILQNLKTQIELLKGRAIRMPSREKKTG